MNDLFGGVVGEARARWHRDRETLVLLAGTFLFVPFFAWFLLVAEPIRPPGATDEQAYAVVVAWIGANLHWLALRVGCELFATSVLLSLYLARDHRTVGALLRRSLVALPGFAAAVLAGWGLLAMGFAAFIVPGVYLYGRVALTGAVSVAEPRVGIIGALARSFALTRGQGWRVTACLAPPLLIGLLALRLVGGLEDLAGGNPVAAAIFAGLAGATTTATALASALFKVALYRRLSAPRHAI